MVRRLEVRTFWEMLPMDFFSSPKRLVPSMRSRRIRNFHLSEMRDRVASTGQDVRDSLVAMRLGPFARAVNVVCVSETYSVHRWLSVSHRN